MNLAIDGIDLARSTEANHREGLDADTVARYAQAIDSLPPITVYRVEGALLVADGLHRIAAAQSLGRTEIPAEIIDGTDREWRAAIILGNLRHGRPWTRVERRCCVGEWLRLYPERSDNWVAEDLGVSKNTVAAVRCDLESTCQIDRLHMLVGRDGKRRPRVLEQGETMALGDIIIGERARKSLGDLSLLVASIADIGLIEPVTVMPDGRLIDGARRIAAFRELGRDRIPVHVVDLPSELHRELAEIDANLQCSSLTVLEQGEHLRRRDELKGTAAA